MRTAHIRQHDNQEQSVREHSMNVAELAASRGRLYALSSTCKLIGLIHDMGKANARFDEYIHYQVAHPDAPLPKDYAPHTPTGAIFAWDNWYCGGGYRRIAAQIIAMVVRGHHGGMLDCVDLSGESPFMNTITQDPDAICYRESLDCFFREVCSPPELDRLFNEAEREITAHLTCLPEESRMFGCTMLARLLLGIVVDADRQDAACFERGEDPLAKSPEVDWTLLCGKLDNYLTRFPREKPIDRLRWQVSEDCLACVDRLGRVYRLTVPTGGAKTFASLRFALARAASEKLRRIFYVVPFNTILDQNARDIREALDGFDGILEHHGNLVFDDEDEYRAHARLTDRWDAPIVLTSMVQFLNSLFRAENTHARRMPAIGRAVIIFDEIQALPPRCTKLFENAISYLTKACDCTVVLCTATQPSLQIEAEEMMPDPGALFASLCRTRFIDERRVARTLEQAATDLAGLQAKRTSVLCIVNKKSQAAFLYERAAEILPEGVLCVHLSTDMCAKHRMDALEQVREALRENRPVLCISTSLIEAGINISFPCVVRFFTGLPSILQSAGRCNRHDELPDKGWVYIWRIADETLGSNLQYIKTGQECVVSALQLAERGVPLDSPDVISDYFARERNAYRHALSYPLQCGTTIVSLLSANTEATNTASHKLDNPARKLILHQAFHTAGKEFHVIDEDTRAIVAPYGEAASLLEQLNGRHTLNEERAILQKLQLYAVNAYPYVYRALSDAGALYPIGDTGVIALRSEYYDEKTGLKAEAGEMPLYDF